MFRKLFGGLPQHFGVSQNRSGTCKILSGTRHLHSGPLKIFSHTPKNRSATAKIPSGAHRNHSASPRFFSGPLRILSGSSGNHSGSPKNHSRSPKNLSGPFRILSGGRRNRSGPLRTRRHAKVEKIKPKSRYLKHETRNKFKGSKFQTKAAHELLKFSRKTNVHVWAIALIYTDSREFFLLFCSSSLPFFSPSHLLTLLPSVFAALPFSHSPPGEPLCLGVFVAIFLADFYAAISMPLDLIS